MSQRPRGQDNAETVRSRLRQYERRERMILWVGAGLVGLIALIPDGVCDPSNIATALLRAMAVTAIVVAGGSLAYARVNFEWQATLIERRIARSMAATNSASCLRRCGAGRIPPS